MKTRNVQKKNKHTLLFGGISKDVSKSGDFLTSSTINYIYYVINNLIRNNKFFFKYLFLIIKKQTILKFVFLSKLYDSFSDNCTTVRLTVRQFCTTVFQTFKWRI